MYVLYMKFENCCKYTCKIKYKGMKYSNTKLINQYSTVTMVFINNNNKLAHSTFIDLLWSRFKVSALQKPEIQN